VTNILHPDGTSEQYVYSNLDLVVSADRLGRWTTNTYDAVRHLIAMQDPLGRITQYDYCECGALEAVIDPAGNVTWWDHDVQSRVTGKFYADGSGTTYLYEGTTSRLHSRIDEKAQQTLYQYYDDNNLESVSYPSAIIPTQTVSYTYDTNYNRIVTMQDGIGATTYTYNPITQTPALGAGKLASVNGPLPNSTVTYQYDQLGRVVSRAINGVAQTTTFDVLGRPTMVANALGAFQYTYVDATQRLASEAYPNGQKNLYLYYNNLGDQRLSQIKHFYPNSTLLSGFGYAYNAVGQITAWTNQWDTLPTRVWFPSYDAADQLTNVAVTGGSGPVTNYTYAYDPAGNRVIAGTNGVQNQYYYNALNQMIGSSVTLPNVSYEWDAENRLTAINEGTNRSEFSYDGLGRRVAIVEKTNGVIMTNNYYLWCGNEICEIRNATGSNVLKHLYPQGEAPEGSVGSTSYFYTRDHLGTVREACDSSGVLATRYDYDPYGELTSIQNNILILPTFAYAGDFNHAPSGLYLTLFRAYNSTAGRWISRDPSGEIAGLNLYAYVSNDPINRTDPAGLISNHGVCEVIVEAVVLPIELFEGPVGWVTIPYTAYVTMLVCEETPCSPPLFPPAPPNNGPSGLPVPSPPHFGGPSGPGFGAPGNPIITPPAGPPDPVHFGGPPGPGFEAPGNPIFPSD